MTRRAARRARRRRRAVALLFGAAGLVGLVAGAAIDVLNDLEDDAQRLARSGPIA